jgi:hypothetical protein
VAAGVRTVLREIEGIIRWHPDLGVLRTQIDELKTRLEQVTPAAPGSLRWPRAIVQAATSVALGAAVTCSRRSSLALL